jgi:hypothetical protein
VKAVLELELVADDNAYYQRQQGQQVRPLGLREEIRMLQLSQPHLRPWVARVTPAGRRMIHQQTNDFSRANGVGSRGVYAIYALDDGVYEVNERTGWTKARRYFIRVQDTRITEIMREEVDRCLSDTSALVS